MVLNFAEVIAQVSLALKNGTPEEQVHALRFIHDLCVLRLMYTNGDLDEPTA